MSIAVGSNFGPFEVCSELGCGAFGTVYRVKDIHTDELSAIKVYKSIRGAIAEVGAFGKLTNAELNFCLPKIDYFAIGTKHCLQMPCLPTDLFEIMYEGSNKYTFTTDEIRHIGYQLCSAVAYLHDSGLIHNDLKPENILLCDATIEMRGSGLRRTDIRVADLGHAIRRTNMTFDLEPTTAYSAPEVILKRRWDYQLDFWSIGCILAELHFGEQLFTQSRSVAHIAQVQGVVGKIKMSAKLQTRFSYPYIQVHPVFKPLLQFKGVPLSELDELFDIIKKMLTPSPLERCSAKEALSMPFFSSPQYSPSHSHSHSHYKLQYIRPTHFWGKPMPIQPATPSPAEGVFRYKSEVFCTIKPTSAPKLVKLLIVPELDGQWTASAIITMALKHDVHGIVIAGNVVGPQKADLRYLEACMLAIQEIAGVRPTFVICGQKDRWRGVLSRVEIARSMIPAQYIENECFVFEGVKIFGTSMTVADTEDDLLTSLMRYNPSELNPFGNLPGDVDVIIAHNDRDQRVLDLIDGADCTLKAAVFGNMSSIETTGFSVRNSVVCVNAGRPLGVTGTPPPRPLVLQIAN